MNIEVLNDLMKQNNISSYFKLANELDIPYTTFLDLVRGKGEKLTNIKLIANYFNVSISTITEVKQEYITIDENNKIKKTLKTDYNSYVTTLI